MSSVVVFLFVVLLTAPPVSAIAWGQEESPNIKDAVEENGVSQAPRKRLTAREWVASIDPLVMTEGMKTFVDSRVGRNQTRAARLLNLRSTLFDPQDGLGIKYGTTLTYTAAETFEEATGNCLSFTLMFVAMARYLDLNAYFVEVDEVMGWSQRGDFGLSHWHMFVEVELDNTVEMIDFLPWSDRSYNSARRIDEARAQAHFHSNVGTEALSAGHTDLALEHFRHALELDPGFHPARVNLAVAYRRAGAADAAEVQLLNVLDADPQNSVAAANLASLYVEAGREEEAARWLGKRDDFLHDNPFHHYRLGVRALQAGDDQAAREHFKRAIDRQPNEAIFHERLAVSLMRLGDRRRARASFKSALRFTDDPAHRDAIKAQLEALPR